MYKEEDQFLIFSNLLEKKGNMSTNKNQKDHTELNKKQENLLPLVR
jgi:hypothetical protein